MNERGIVKLTEQEAVEQIIKTVKRAEPGSAPFALVLGSGFSQGLVPTTRELVEESLPLWIHALNEGKPFKELSQAPPVDRAAIAKQFWKSFLELNRPRGCDLELDVETGLPKDGPAAYKAAFNSNYFDAVGEAADARRFQRALMQLDQTRLNAAHFLLASLLGVQPGKNRPSSLFKTPAAFCRLILTTNFDPFLQIALQAVNRLYFMSDTPDLGISDEISEDQTDAIHLVYLHGSIHRRSQAASDDDIRDLKLKNARTLAPVLKRHGVIVLGYSGWDDTIVEALAACDRFDHRVYWCGRQSDPLAKGAFGEKVPDILRKPSTQYVKIDTAGSFMAQLCTGLVEGLPRLLSNPIGQLHELLAGIDLAELDFRSKAADTTGLNSPQLSDTGTPSQALHQAKESTLKRLKEAEQFFHAQMSPASPDKASSPLIGNASASAPAESLPAQSPVSRDAEWKARQLLASARLASGLGNHQEALKLCEEALLLSPLGVLRKIELWMFQASEFHLLGQMGSSIACWGQIIDLPAAPVEWVAIALHNRGFSWGRKGDTEKELADYTRVIEGLPGARVEEVARSLNNRGVTWGQKGETEKALADYTRVIEGLPGAPVEQVAKALYNRGVIWARKGETEKTLADYTRVIEGLPGAPVEQVAMALNNRGITLDGRGEAEKALADYTLVIEELSGVPVEQVAKALINRGVAWGRKRETEKALADFTRVIEGLPGAPVEEVAKALINRGVAWGQKGETGRALADYACVIGGLPGAPVEEIAKALNNRGRTWGINGEIDKALADCTRVVEGLQGAPVEQVANALANRGWAYYKADNYQQFLADTEAALNKQPGLDSAQFNLGLALLATGRDAEALGAYRRAGEAFPTSIQTHGLDDLVEAQKTWLSGERAGVVIQLLEGLKK